MLELAKKAVLIGTGMALAATDRIQDVVGNLAEKGETARKEAQGAVEDIIKKTQKTRHTVEDEAEKVVTDFTSFWFYASWTDEIEDQVEKAVTLLLRQLHIPERRELEDIKARIERLEQEPVQDKRE